MSCKHTGTAAAEARSYAEANPTAVAASPGP